MFGLNLQVQSKKQIIKLHQFSLEQIKQGALEHNYLSRIKYLSHSQALTPEDVEKRYPKIQEDEGSAIWGIFTESEELIGELGIEGIQPVSGFATSYIMIINDAYWGQGIAHSCLLAMIRYSVEHLNLNTIYCTIAFPNTASITIHEKVGFVVTGTKYRSAFKFGDFLDWHTLQWFNPERKSLLYPDKNIPELVEGAFSKSAEAYEEAKELVQFL